MEDKKFYWIKLKTDFFNTPAVDFLLSQENGSEYVVLYQMLCCMTANNKGSLSTQIGEIIVPFNADKIARDTKYFSKDTVMVALELFKKLGLIYSDEGDCLRLAGIEEMTGSESASKEAVKKREYRNKKETPALPAEKDTKVDSLVDTTDDKEVDNAVDKTEDTPGDNIVDKSGDNLGDNTMDNTGDNVGDILGDKKGTKCPTEIEIRDKSLEKEKHISNEICKKKVAKATTLEPVKKSFGHFNNVLLTEEEYQKLAAEYPETVNEIIQTLDDYMQMKDYKVKSHYMAIRQWVVDAWMEKKQRKERLNGKPYRSKPVKPLPDYMNEKGEVLKPKEEFTEEETEEARKEAEEELRKITEART